MIRAAIFDLDGTLLDSVDLHAMAWQEALAKFGHDAPFEKVRSQIGKGGDKLIPVQQQKDYGRELDAWRGTHFKNKYLPLIRPFSAVPELFKRVRAAGLQIAIATSAKKDELQQYLDIAGIARLIDEATSSDDVEESKPAPDIFQVAMAKLKTEASSVIAVGDTPYDAQASPYAHDRHALWRLR